MQHLRCFGICVVFKSLVRTDHYSGLSAIANEILSLIARIKTFCWRRSLSVIMGVCALALITLPKTSVPDPAMAIEVLVALICRYSEF